MEECERLGCSDDSTRRCACPSAQALLDSTIGRSENVGGARRPRRESCGGNADTPCRSTRERCWCAPLRTSTMGDDFAAQRPWNSFVSGPRRGSDRTRTRPPSPGDAPPATPPGHRADPRADAIVRHGVSMGRPRASTRSSLSAIAQAWRRKRHGSSTRRTTPTVRHAGSRAGAQRTGVVDAE